MHVPQVLTGNHDLFGTMIYCRQELCSSEEVEKGCHPDFVSAFI